MFHRCTTPLVLTSLLGVLAASPALSRPSVGADRPIDFAALQDQREQAVRTIEAMKEARRAQARPTSIYSPLYSFVGEDRTELYVLNNVADPVRFELSALDERGEPLPLGEFEVGVTRHLQVPLGELLAGSGKQLRRGSLRLSYLGDEDTLQAWTVLRRGDQVVEVTFEGSGESAWNEEVLWWDEELVRGARPVVTLFNAGDRPLSYVVSHSPSHREASPRQQLLEPGASRRLALPAGRIGSLRVSHDGDAGALKVVGLLEGPGKLSLLPTATDVDFQKTTTFETIRVPYTPGVARSAVIRLHNAAQTARKASLDLFDPVTGFALMNITETLAAGESRSIDIGAQIASRLGRKEAGEVRVRVAGNEPGLAVAGSSRLAGGEAFDLAFFRRQNAHSSGSYPLLPLSTHDTFTTLVNLGEEPSEVVAQFYWDGGTYAYGPFVVVPGASYRLDVAQVAAAQQPDLLGRTLDPELRHGFVKWTTRRGSNDLIARTEARPSGKRDSFGFNCFGCCGEIPWGEVIPSTTSFFVGQSPSFEACVNFSTCNGNMGPYLAYPTSFTVPTPFSWNGLNVSASAAGQEVVRFNGVEEGTLPGSVCLYRNMPVSGSGTPSSCKTLLKKVHNPSSSWSPTQTCVAQVGGEPANQKCPRCQACCNQILAYKICSKVALATANNEHQACLTTCAIDLNCN